MLRRVALGCCLLFAACTRAPTSGLTLLLEDTPDSLDDRLSLSADGQRLANLISPGLLTFDDSGSPVPDLAESFDFSSPTTLDFTLRAGLTFHDGRPVQAADVTATFSALLDGSFKSPRAARLAPVQSVEALDERHVRFTLVRPFAPILAELTLGILPADRAQGASARLQDALPVGAGPFRFVARPSEERIELAPFEHYYGGAPAMRALHVRVVRDETTRVLELERGSGDLVLNAVSPAVLAALEHEPSTRVLSAPGAGTTYLGFNLRHGPLADVRVRRALCHALDVTPIVDLKFHGRARAAATLLPPGHWAASPATPCTHDLELARQLLDEAGYLALAGAPRFRLVYKTSTDRFRRSVALLLADQLAQVGIEVDVQTLEFGILFNDIRKANFELFSLKFPTIQEPDLLRSVFSSANIPSAQNQMGGLNRGGLSDPELDAMMETASQGTREERHEAYQAVQARLAEDLPVLPLWHEDNVAVTSTRVEGFVPSATGSFRPLAQAREVAR